MSEIKTEECQGQVYEIGQSYLFSDGGDYWHCLRLKRIVKGYPTRFETWVTPTKFTVFDFIDELPASENIGTITPAPIELVDGAAYMFCLETTWVGFYRVSRKSFFDRLVGGNKICGLAEVTNIRPMTVESK